MIGHLQLLMHQIAHPTHLGKYGLVSHLLPSTGLLLTDRATFQQTDTDKTAIYKVHYRTRISNDIKSTA